MFNLKKELEEWKNRLILSDVYKEEDVRELQSHMEDQMEVLMESGLSQEESFIITSKRLGNHSEITREYTKVHPQRIWLKHLLQFIGGFLFVTISSKFLRAICSLLSSGIKTLIDVDYKLIYIPTVLLLNILFLFILFSKKVGLITRIYSLISKILGRLNMALSIIIALLTVGFFTFVDIFSRMISTTIITIQDYGEISMFDGVWNLTFMVILVITYLIFEGKYKKL